MRKEHAKRNANDCSYALSTMKPTLTPLQRVHIREGGGSRLLHQVGMRMSPRPFNASLHHPTQSEQVKSRLLNVQFGRRVRPIHSIQLVNPITHSNHSIPSTINMVLFYLYVHDRTEWRH